MVAIFSGLGAGLARGSASVLGGSGQLGSALLGRGGESVSVNAATGNLVISQQDEFLAGRGPDLSISRTYNSLAEVSDRDNLDQWQMGSTRWLFDVPSAAARNTAGSTIKRQGADGSVVTYVYETHGGVPAYWATDGDGAYDKLVESTGTWVWTDGSSQVTETYEDPTGDGTFRIRELADADGNKLTYSYVDGTDRIARISTYNDGTANPTTGHPEQSYVQYVWNPAGTRIDEIRTYYTDYGANPADSVLGDNVDRTLTRTRYGYDSAGRLHTVTVDLSPEDGNVEGDGRKYVTTYEYDGASNRVISIGQDDGSLLTIAYDTAGRVTTLAETVTGTTTRTTTLAYGASYTTVTGPDNQVTRLDYDGGNLIDAAVSSWVGTGVDREAAAAIGGEAATLMTSSADATTSYVRRSVGAVAAGSTVRFTVSLQAYGTSATSQSLGLYGETSGWGTDVVSARIVSGPGTLVTSADGLWQVDGLSASQATRIEITRTYAQSETVRAYVYVDRPGGTGDGQQLLVAGAAVTVESPNLAAPAPGTWILSGATGTPSGGTAATLVTSPAGEDGSFAFTSIGTVAAGTAVTFTVSLQAAGGWATEQSLGLWGGSSTWGSGGVTAQIVSGPGTLVTSPNGLWKVTGLSSTQATRIQITRTYAQSEEARAYVYVDRPGGYRDGQQLIVSDASVTTGGASLASAAVGTWSATRATRALGGTVGGAEATAVATTVNGQTAFVSSSIGTVAAGTTVRFTVSLQALAGSATTQALGLWGGTSTWGSGGVSARIVSGPGTLTTSSTGLWQVSGLSTTEGTRIEITRTYSQREEVRAYVYVDQPGGSRIGQQLLVAGAEVTTDAPYQPTRRLTRITAPAVGGVSQTLAFAYDLDGNVVRVVDGAGRVSARSYDDRGNVLTSTDANGNMVTRTYGTRNELLSETRMGSDRSGAAAAQVTRYVYGAGNHLRYVVSNEDRVTEYRYTPAGDLDRVVGYPEHLYTGTEPLTETTLNTWRNGLSDRSSLEIAAYSYDSRGDLVYSIKYGVATAGGAPSTGEGYSRTYYAYDQAGRVLTRYEQGETGERFVYDGLGRMVAAVDAVGGVTTYRFDDANTTTIVHMSTGLTRTMVYDKTGELISEIASTPGYQPDELDADLGAWATSRVTRTDAAPIGGEAAYTYTLGATGLAGVVSRTMSVQAHETVTWRITVRGNPTDLHRLALYGSTDTWGTLGVTDASAVIVSGPGAVVNTSTNGGRFDLTGLSATQDTVIELRRTFDTAQTVTAFFYVGGLTGTGATVPAGTAVTLAATNLTRTVTDTAQDILSTTNYVYDASGRLRMATDATGHNSYYLYDASGRKIADINHYGQVTGYRYDAAGRVAATVRYGNVLTGTQLANLADPTKTVALPAASATDDLWSWSVYDEAGRLIEAIDGEGGVAVFSYDASDRLVKTVSYFNKLSPTQLASLKSALPTALVLPLASTALDAVSRSFYDGDGRLVGALDGEGYLSEIVYDESGRKVGEVAYAAQTTESLWAAGSFDALKASAAPTSSANRSMHYVYDGQGLLRFTVDNAGFVTSYTYNVAGKLTSTIVHAGAIATTDFTYDNVELRVAEIASDAADRESYAIYNALGQLAFAVDAGGQVTGFTYDAAGRVSKTVQYATVRPTSTLPNLGQMNTFAANNASDDDRITRSWYDAAGNLRFTVDAEGYVHRFDYDDAGRLIHEITWANAVTVSDTATIADVHTLTASAGSSIDLQYAYDSAGRREWVYDGEGYRTRSTWNANGTLASVERAYGTADAARTRYAYDGAGRVTAEYSADGVEPDQVLVQYGYDGLGNRISVTDGRGKVTQYAYDQRGLLVGTTNAAGGTTAYEYNGFGEVVKATDARLNSTYSYYDNLGRVTLVRDAESYLSETSYSAFGEVASVTRYAAMATGAASTTTRPTISASVADAITRFTYDKLGRLVQKIDAEGYVETSSYSAFGQLTGFSRYELSVYGSYGGQSGTVQDAFASAGQERLEADALAAATAAPDAAAASALAAKNAAQAAYDAAVATANASAAAVTTQQGVVNGLQGQVDARSETAIVASPLTYLQAYLSGLAAQLATANNYASTLSPEQYFPYYAEVIFPLEQQATAVSNVKISVQNGSPLPSDYYHIVLLQAGYTASESSSYIALRQSLSSAQATLAAKQTTAATDVTARNAAQTALTQANTAYTQAANAATAAHGAAATAQGEAVAALAAAVALRAALSNALPAFTLGGLQGAASTAFQYDHLGNLTGTTDARGFYEAYTYDAYGRRATMVAKSATTAIGAGGTTTYTYDRRGLLLSETLPMQAYDSNGNALGPIVNAYQYDGRGNLRYRTEAQGRAEQRVTEYRYDRQDRLTATVSEAVSGVTIDPSTRAVSAVSGAPTESISYDDAGNVIRTVDAAGAATVFFYDQLNRKTREVNALGTCTVYQYDANGNVTNIRIYETPVTPPATGGAESVPPPVLTGNYRETSFAYDKLGRMTSSAVVLPADYRTGTWSGSVWTNAVTATLTTSYQYDAFGNVVTLTDPNLNATFSYYDKLGRKTAQVDGQGYLTEWAYDSDGNVLTERRHAVRFTGTPALAAPPSVAFDAADRVTVYTYDQNGNRLTEARLGVVVYNTNAGAIAGTTMVVTSTIGYLYNGLGQVTRKTQATGDQINYTYDAGGRLTKERRVNSGGTYLYLDQLNNQVTPTVDYFYNGLGNLALSVQAAGGDALARETRYAYGVGGRLASVTDAEGGVRSYSYDRAGRTVLEYYTRKVTAADGTSSTVIEGTGTRYDLLGRSLGQGFYTKSGTTWTFQSGSTYTTLEYDAFGDVVRTGNNGAWQQENKYDLAGRLWASSAGDGVWKYFGYDKNGNQTLAITSAGADLAGKSLAQAVALIGQTDVNGTYTVYDGRNLATSVVEEGRQLTAAGTVKLTTNRAYNAFGEVASETNAAGAATTYSYNTMGRMIRSESPTVSMTLTDGTKRWIKPSQDFYYDAAGRLVATRDAGGTYAPGGTIGNGAVKGADTGNLTRRTLLAGTGYDGSDALVTFETHADGGIRETRYDVHGNARILVDEMNRTLATQSYDRLGRLTKAVRLGGLTDSYAYDLLGHLVEHGNSYSSTLNAPSQQYLDGNTEITTYDIEGRVVSSRAFGGDVTTVAYTWLAGLEAAGTNLTDTGGWSKLTTYANTMTLAETSDLFGRAIGKTDLGGHATVYTYDLAGRLTKSQIASTSYNYEYYNTGQVKKAYTVAPNWTFYTSTVTGAARTTYLSQTTQNAVYTYDEVGNRLTEYGTLVNGTTTVVWKDHAATYDALGRLETDTMITTEVQPESSVAFEYDANGNIRKKTSTYHSIDANGIVATALNTKTAWYRYNEMNWVVVNNGVLAGDQIVLGLPVSIDFLGDPSQLISYNKAGQRTAVTTNQYFQEYIPDQQTPWGTLTGFTATYSAPTREEYTYDTAGRLEQVKIANSWLNVGAFILAMPTNPVAQSFVETSATATLRTKFAYDAMGRQIDQKGYDSDGSTVVYHTTTTYNAKGQVSGTFASTLKSDGKTYTQTVTNQFGTEGTESYALGAVTSFDSVNTVTGGTTKTAHTLNSFVWWDAALQDKIEYQRDVVWAPDDVWVTSFTYNGLGQLTKSVIADGKTRTVTFSLDEIGQIIRRDETGGSWQTGAPHEIWYRLGEREIGYVGNNGGEDPTMLGSLEQLQTSSTNQGTFRNGGTASRSNVGFAQALDPINSYRQGSQAGGYTVRSGDTLQAIAKRLYGDASLWYKIAEVNGLSANSGLSEGQQLTLPSGVTRNTYTDESFRPYDPAQAIGDLSPTSPKPTKGPRCGVFGQILAMVVAVTAGNLVSQAFNNYMRLQDGFSWKSLGVSVVAAAVSFGVGQVLGAGAMAGSQLLGDVVRGAASSAISQGVSVATGLQDHFSWAGVAAAGVAAGGFGAVVRGLNSDHGSFGDGTQLKDSAGRPLHDSGGNPIIGDKGTWYWDYNSATQSFFTPGAGSQIAGTSAAVIASAATRSAMEGSSFGRNLMAGVPDIIGQVVNGLAQGSLRNDRKADNTSIGMGDISNPAADVTANPSDKNGEWTKDWIVTDDGDLVNIRAAREAYSHGLPASETRKIMGEIIHHASAEKYAVSATDDTDLKYIPFGDLPGGAAKGTDYAQYVVDTVFVNGHSPRDLAGMLHGEEGSIQFWQDTSPESYAGALISTSSFWQLENFVSPVLENLSVGDIDPQMYAETSKIVNRYVGGINKVSDRETNKLVYYGLFLPMGAGMSGPLALAGASSIGGGSLTYYSTAMFLGGSGNTGLGVLKAQMTGEQITAGSLTGDFVSGSLFGGQFTVFRESALVNDLASGAMSGGTGNYLTQLIDKQSIDYGEVGYNALTGSLFSAASGRVGDTVIGGVNSGSSSWESTYLRGRTRIDNGNATNMSAGVAFRGGVANQATEIRGNVMQMFLQTTLYIPSSSPKKP